MPLDLSANHPLAISSIEAIRGGDLLRLRRLLVDTPGLATARITNIGENCGTDVARSLLHIATDWPGHFPNISQTVTLLTESGSDVNARLLGANPETPLHWAASSNDVAALETLVQHGADLEASGAVIAGGTPLDDAVAFAQWATARRLVERGARTAIWHLAALGLMDGLRERMRQPPQAPLYPWGKQGVGAAGDTTIAFWCACHGGQREAAEYLLGHHAQLNWISDWDQHTACDTAQREGHSELVAWLRDRGGRSAQELSQK